MPGGLQAGALGTPANPEQRLGRFNRLEMRRTQPSDPQSGGTCLETNPTPSQSPDNYRGTTLALLFGGGWLGQYRDKVGQTGRSSRWSNVHPGSVGKPRAGRRARGIAVKRNCCVVIAIRLITITTRASDFRKCYAGKPDTARSCLSGLEGAGRKRAPLTG
jgi:hypothetical protein